MLSDDVEAIGARVSESPTMTGAGVVSIALLLLAPPATGDGVGTTVGVSAAVVGATVPRMAFEPETGASVDSTLSPAGNSVGGSARGATDGSTVASPMPGDIVASLRGLATGAMVRAASITGAGVGEEMGTSVNRTRGASTRGAGVGGERGASVNGTMGAPVGGVSRVGSVVGAVGGAVGGGVGGASVGVGAGVGVPVGGDPELSLPLPLPPAQGASESAHPASSNMHWR